MHYAPLFFCLGLMQLLMHMLGTYQICAHLFLIPLTLELVISGGGPDRKTFSHVCKNLDFDIPLRFYSGRNLKKILLSSHMLSRMNM